MASTVRSNMMEKRIGGDEPATRSSVRFFIFHHNSQSCNTSSPTEHQPPQNMSKSLCIAICSTGQMGSSFAAVVKAQDESVRLITNLSGRSARTVELAKSAGIEDVGSYEAVLSQADVFLSVLVPDLALRLAKEVADAATTASPLRTRYFVDLNAIAPSSAATGADFFSSTPVSFVDGGIIGGPATASSAPLLVLSGPQAGDVDSLLSPLFLGRTKTVGDKIGQASALKLSYASLTKGVNALALNASLLASEWGVLHAFEDEVAASNPALTKVIERIPRNTAKVRRNEDSL